MLRSNQTKRKLVQSKLFIGLNLLLVLLLVGPLSGVVLAGPEKVAICHLDDEGNYHPISVSERALKAHLGHGDKVVGVDMDANCHPLDSDGDGVQDVADNCVDIANPGQEDRYGSSAGDACEDLDGDGTLDVDETHFCLSIDGVLLESRGLARCISTASTGTDPNVAVSNGDNSGSLQYGAFANSYYDNSGALPGNGSQAIAIGDNSLAYILYGNHDSVTAIDGGIAIIDRFYSETAGYNVARAATHGSAIISNSSNSTAIATSGGTVQIHGQVNGYASAENTGWALMVAALGINNSATASGAQSVAVVEDGTNNSATATGDGAAAWAFGGNNNSATSTGVYTCAGNGDDNEVAVDEDLCNN